MAPPKEGGGAKQQDDGRRSDRADRPPSRRLRLGRQGFGHWLRADRCRFGARLRRLYRFIDRPDFGDKAVTAARHGDDEAMCSRRLSKDATQGRDVLGKIIFFDDRVRPDRFHEALFVEHGALMLEQIEQSLEDSRSERDGRAVSPQKATAQV